MTEPAAFPDPWRGRGAAGALPHGGGHRASTQAEAWLTTGACATAATAAAYTALVTGSFPDPVEIVLPKGSVPRSRWIRSAASALDARPPGSRS